MQNALPFRRGSATNRPRESVMLDEDVIEHRCPDLVVPQQRAETADASMAAQTKELRWENAAKTDNAHTNAEIPKEN